MVIVDVSTKRAITYSEVRRNLKSVIDQVVSDSAPTMIVRRKGQEGAVIVSESEWASIEETLHLLRSPTNAKALLESIAELDTGQGVEHDLIDR